MYIITFYSFKGGVGRTMALVNVGLELVRLGRRVLLVDFDLEAPGLTTYDALRQQADHPGVVEYVTEYLRTSESPEVARFIYSVDLTRVRSSHKQRNAHKQLPSPDDRESTGQLWVMPAGKGDAAYAAALAGINWSSLYEQQDGYLFFEDTKAQWREFIKPDYVLIDSRTGHTDVGGICTRQLADAVVLLFTPNEQNRLGLRDVCDAIRAEEKENGRAIAVHLVMSNVPRLDDEEGILRRRVKEFLATLKFPRLDAVIDRYDSLMHLDQRVFALERPRSRLALQYRKLVHQLIIRNPEDREGVIVQLDQLRHDSGFFARKGAPWITGEHLVPEALIASGVLLPTPDEIIASRPRRPGRAVLLSEKLRERLQRITDAFADDQEILIRVAEIHSEMSNFETAAAILDQVVRLGENPQALLMRSRASFQLGRKDQAIQDLLSLIQLRTGREDLVVEAIRDLHRLDSDRLRREITSERLDALSPTAKARIASFLATPEDSFAKAISLLEDAVAGVQDGATSGLLHRHQLSLYLLYRREWDKVIALWQGQTNFVTRRYHAMALFHEALARWGMTGEMPESLCRQIVDLARAPSACDTHAPDCQALALVNWRTGDAERAKGYVQRALRQIARRVTPELSYWRCLEVPPEIFREDCQQILKLIDGAPLQPLVFGKRRCPGS